MVDGARAFGKRVERAYSDLGQRLSLTMPKLSLLGNNEIDVIVSEPSIHGSAASVHYFLLSFIIMLIVTLMRWPFCSVDSAL